LRRFSHYGQYSIEVAEKAIGYDEEVVSKRENDESENQVRVMMSAAGINRNASSRQPSRLI
jgi:hypothetical protein